MGFSRTDFELEELSDIAQLDDMKIAMGFIRAIENASLDDDDCRLGEEAIDRLRHPPQQPVDIDSPDLRLGLDLFNSLSNSSQETYTSVRQAILRRHPEDNIPSYDQIKRRVAEITGVVSIVHDMCVNTCIAFTGPFSQLDLCTSELDKSAGDGDHGEQNGEPADILMESVHERHRCLPRHDRGRDVHGQKIDEIKQTDAHQSQYDQPKAGLRG